MLVLSRERDQALLIGDNIEVTVVDIRGDKVRLGISAPKEIPIHRKEVVKAMQREAKRKELEAAEAKKHATETPVLDALILCKGELFFQTKDGNTIKTEYPHSHKTAEAQAKELNVSWREE